MRHHRNRQDMLTSNNLINTNSKSMLSSLFMRLNRDIRNLKLR